MIKVTDYIAKKLKEHGIDHVFMVTGGGAMHLNDSLGKGLTYICNHHEQGAAIAAEGYARVTQTPAAVNVTTGPGGLNALTGVMGQWTDSVPAVYISGQVKFETTLAAVPYIKGLRQMGDQEVDIISVVKPLTKFAEMVTDVKDIRYLLEKAIYEATHGRPGPTWLDVPMNIQGAMVDEASLVGFEPPVTDNTRTNLATIMPEIAERIRAAKRPVIIAGYGMRVSGGLDAFEQLLELCDIPVVTTFNGMDVITEDHKNYIGRTGTFGNRAGNFAMQNADLLITIGTRNNVRQVSYNWKCFAREAYKIIVDIDPAELEKPTVVPDMPVCADAKEFVVALAKELGNSAKGRHAGWLEWCTVRKHKYPTVLPEYYDRKDGVHPYVFMDILGHCIPEGAIVACGDGTACVAPYQAMPMKKKFRIFWNSGCASMGFDLPAAVGACVANGFKDTICLTGDGSLQMNIQELQTMIHHNMPIKMIYFNNDGYISIKQTQDSFFAGNRVGTDPKSGVSFPDIHKIGAAYGFKTCKIDSHENLKENIEKVINAEGAIICEVICTEDYKFLPKVSSRRLEDGTMVSAPLEDLAPFLDRDEFRSNLLIKEW